MRTILVVCFFLASHLHAESTAGSSNATSISTSTTTSVHSSLSPADATMSAPLVNVDDELAKIVATCLTFREYEQLTGNIVRHTIARAFLSTYLIRECVATIGLTELRAALDFAPPRPWQTFNETKPSEGELAAAPTVEAYFDLREPRSEMRSLDSYYLLESNLIPAIPFLDERFPAIRTIFRRKFAEIREQNPGVVISHQNPGVVISLDRKIVDRMIDEFVVIYRRLRTATFKMTTNTDCWTYD